MYYREKYTLLFVYYNFQQLYCIYSEIIQANHLIKAPVLQFLFTKRHKTATIVEKSFVSTFQNLILKIVTYLTFN